MTHDNNIPDNARGAARLYEEAFGVPPLTIQPAASGGGDRRYFRLSGPGARSVIATVGPDRAENHAFIRLSQALAARGIRVPEILAVAPDESVYLQQDLGDTPLASILGTPQCGPIIPECMRSLARMQVEGSSLVAAHDAWQKPFDRRQVMWDLNYFKYEYLRPGGVIFDEDALQDDFDDFAACVDAIGDSCRGFMYRDCQSRNVMVCGAEPWWIDFQAARLGPCLYDAVSFLWQAKAGFTDEQRQRYLDIYASEFARLRGVDVSEVLRPLPLLVALRTLQVLGAYGLRGLVERRAHFIESIPAALRSLSRQVSDSAFSRWPELERVCRAICSDSRFQPRTPDRLTVEVFSFSYKRGYPADYSGNGGGFMFDCRAMHNPGRYEQYRQLTGLDREVIDFLEQRGEVQPFLAAAHTLTDAAVARYVERGFTGLQIGFGCTGGRHRSVYCAEATARHLKQRFGDSVRIVLHHREQDIKRTL